MRDFAIDNELLQERLKRRSDFESVENDDSDQITENFNQEGNLKKKFIFLYIFFFRIYKQYKK